MAIPTSINDLDTNEAMNSPAGSDTVGGTLDNFLRSHAAIIKRQFSKGANVNSASTTVLPPDCSYVNVVNVISPINGFSANFPGRIIYLRFEANITLNNSANLILPGAQNIVTRSNDVLVMVNESGSIWRMIGGTVAASVGFTPSGSVQSTNVQAAIAELDSEKLAKASNLSDLTSAADARSNLGLGTAAVSTVSVNTTDEAGKVARIGDYGLGHNMVSDVLSSWRMNTGFYYASSSLGGNLYGGGTFMLHVKYSTSNDGVGAFRLSNDPYTENFYLHHGSNSANIMSQGRKIWHEGNFKPSIKSNVGHTHPVVHLSGTVEFGSIHHGQNKTADVSAGYVVTGLRSATNNLIYLRGRKLRANA